MKPLFIYEPSPGLRAIILIAISIVLMTVDQRHPGYVENVRAQMSVIVYPFQYIVDFPAQAAQWLSENFSTRMQLLAENVQLREQNLLLQASLQKFQDLKSENERLRSLLDSPKKGEERALVAELLSVDVDPSSRKLLINKGRQQGVFEGQPVIDAYGVMGQVVEAGLLTSVVLLITDPNHSLPVQLVRTGLRTIAVGIDTTDRLDLLYLTNNSGIVVGDEVVTSGLGGRFPQGYPVGKVVEFNPDIAQPYAQVQAVPSARLERNREVLLIWWNEKNQPAPNLKTAPLPPPKNADKSVNTTKKP